MVNRKIQPRQQGECADHWTTRVLSDVVLMTPEEIKRALLDVWSDGCKFGQQLNCMTV